MIFYAIETGADGFRPAVRGGPAARDVDAGDQDGEVRRVVPRGGAVHPLLAAVPARACISAAGSVAAAAAAAKSPRNRSSFTFPIARCGAAARRAAARAQGSRRGATAAPAGVLGRSFGFRVGVLARLFVGV